MSILTRSPEKSREKNREKDEAPAAPQPGRRRAGAATTAAVNLLSPWVLDELRVRRLRRRFALGALALLVGIAGTWGLLRLDLARDRQDLKADEAIGAGLKKQIAGLSDIETYVANVNLRVTRVEETMLAQIGYGDVLLAIQDALPPGATVETLEVTLPVTPVAPAAPAGEGDAAVPAAAVVPLCPGGDPFGARPVVACVAITGFADSRGDVTDMVQTLAKSDLFVEPFVSVTTAGEASEGGAKQKIEFQGTLGLDDATYTGRFEDIDGSDGKTGDKTANTGDKATDDEKGGR